MIEFVDTNRLCHSFNHEHWLGLREDGLELALTPQLLIQLGTIGWLNLIRREVARRSEILPVFFKGFILRSFQVPMIPVLCAAAGMVLYGLMREEERNLYFFIAAVVIVYGFSYLRHRVSTYNSALP